MNRFFRVLTAAALLLAMGMGMGMGAVAAQENATDENATAIAPDALEDELGENETVADAFAHQEEIRFNNDTRIVGWEFRNGVARVAIESDRRTGVKVSDNVAGIGEEGAIQVPTTSQFVERDEVTTVTMDVAEFQGGHSVSVTVDGMTVRLSTEMRGENPLQYFGGESGLFAGMGLSIAMSGAAAAFVIWREETGVIEA